MDCNDYQKHMSMLIDGELGQHSLQALETHLAACSGCRNAYGRMAALNSALKDVDLYRPPSMLASRVKARFAEESGPTKSAPHSLRMEASATVSVDSSSRDWRGEPCRSFNDRNLGWRSIRGEAGVSSYGCRPIIFRHCFGHCC